MSIFAPLGTVWNAFLSFVFQILLFLVSITHDWGLAIILLTVIFRLAVMPLTLKQTKSVFEMQRIQPKIKEIQEKYKNDKERQNEELMKFYQENKVNPLGGCLPALLQMPLFIALYSVLGNSRGKAGLMLQYFNHLSPAAKAAAIKFWVLIPDITKTPASVFQVGMKLGGFWTALIAVIPYATLVVLFGLSIWLPQQLMTADKQQRQIGATMAIVFLYFGWVSPAGVLVYWVTSSAIGLAQQQIQLRMLRQAQAREEAAAEDAKKLAKAEKAQARSGGAAELGEGETAAPARKVTKRRRKK